MISANLDLLIFPLLKKQMIQIDALTLVTKKFDHNQRLIQTKRR